MDVPRVQTAKVRAPLISRTTLLDWLALLRSCLDYVAPTRALCEAVHVRRGCELGTCHDLADLGSAARGALRKRPAPSSEAKSGRKSKYLAKCLDYVRANARSTVKAFT
jgi:hypothetical protein